MNAPEPTWIAFAKTKCIASGAARDVATKVKAFVERDAQTPVLLFDAVTSKPVELDLRGSLTAVLRRLPKPVTQTAKALDESELPKTPGRPKLGVTAREVTLLPRHWDWLASQPGGASVSLRKLVEQALRANRQLDRVREARESAYRFMHAMAGNEAGFEDASRALFAGDDRLREIVAKWPADVRKHVLALADAAVAEQGQAAQAS